MTLGANSNNGILDDDEVLEGDINEKCREASYRTLVEELSEDNAYDSNVEIYDDELTLANRAYEERHFDR